MNMLCKLNMHDWIGCKCKRCGITRNEGHDWIGCKCKRCGIKRNEGHIWQGCTCNLCGAIREDNHHWKGCKCRICGRARDEGHTWGETSCLVCGKRMPADMIVPHWAESLLEKEDYKSLAAINNSQDYSASSLKWKKRDYANKLLLKAGPEAVDGIIEELNLKGVGQSDLADILVKIGDKRAVPHLKRWLDRGVFKPYGFTDSTVREFVEQYPELHEEEETAICAVCGAVKPISEMKICEGQRICPGDCWSKRGRVVKSGSGTECPHYKDGICIIRGEDTGLCSLGHGHGFDYRNDCFVYKMNPGR